MVRYFILGTCLLMGALPASARELTPAEIISRQFLEPSRASRYTSTVREEKLERRYEPSYGEREEEVPVKRKSNYMDQPFPTYDRPTEYKDESRERESRDRRDPNRKTLLKILEELE